jgi:hypothetical protein
MKALRPGKKWVLAIIGLLLVLLVVKVVLLLTAKPKITVDYVAEYNRISRPANYDLNDNAAPYYQKAFDVYVPMPDELRKPHINWPVDFNDTEQALLEKWLASNSRAFEYFKIAANKPYYWLERYPDEDNYMSSITFPELSLLKHLSETLLWNAKLAASKGRSQTAFENIIDCYKAGRQKCRVTSWSTEQYVGLGIKQNAVNNAFVILDRTKTESKALEFFQNSLQAEFDNDAYIPSIQTEKYFLYDALQRTFIDNGKGTGRLAWRAAYNFDVMHEWTNIKRRLNCFIGPTRNQIVQQIEKVFTTSNQLMTKTPWQIKSEGHNYFEEIKKINNSNFFLRILSISPEGIFHSYHKTRAKTEALIAVLAILRFKTDKGQFPATLNELVSAGYLQFVPMDPYSNGPLVYTPAKDNFKLYSVGEDFSDDDGVIETKTRQESDFGRTYTVPYLQVPDIIYWPVKDLKKLRYELTIKGVETRRAIEEANQAK